MLGLDQRAARYTWTATAVALLLVLVYLMRRALFVFVVALLFAYLLSPLVDFLDRVLPTSRTRTPALALAYVLLIAVLVFGGIQIGSRVVEQLNALVSAFPKWLAQLEQPSGSASAEMNSFKAQIIQTVREQIKLRSNDIVAALPKAGWKVLTVASDLIYIIIIPILGFFFLKDGREIRQHFLEAIEDNPRRARMDDLLADVNVLLAHYMRAILTLSLATFVFYSIFFAIMGVPYSVLLGVFAGALEFIPMIGPLTAAVAILLVAGFSGAHALAVLIFLAVYRVFQDYVLAPHVMGSGVELHPLLVLFGVFAGAEISGIAGAFLSVPVLALLRILYRHVRKARIARQLSSAPSL